MFEQLGLIGCGLMGGSFALALKKAGLVKRVVGYSKSPSTTDRARQLGVIDVEAPSALLAVGALTSCWWPCLWPPPRPRSRPSTPGHAADADHGRGLDQAPTWCRLRGVRCAIAVRWVLFVPARTPSPAAKWRGGTCRRLSCINGRQVILTPTGRTSPRSCAGQERVASAGCRVSSMSPESHDAAFAAVSHLPTCWHSR